MQIKSFHWLSWNNCLSIGLITIIIHVTHNMLLDEK